jgi:hypothetical protein
MSLAKVCGNLAIRPLLAAEKWMPLWWSDTFNISLGNLLMLTTTILLLNFKVWRMPVTRKYRLNTKATRNKTENHSNQVLVYCICGKRSKRAGELLNNFRSDRGLHGGRWDLSGLKFTIITLGWFIVNNNNNNKANCRPCESLRARR